MNDADDAGETTEGMGRAGYYDTHSEYQRSVAESGSSLIERCADLIPLPADGRTFMLVDYGCSTGANSIAMVTKAVAALRARAPDLPVAVVHNDVPTNDFNQLFANLLAAPGGYLHLHPAVLPLASAASFFGPAAPAASVRLGLSFSAAHWLRAQPDVVVPGAFYFCEATAEARDSLARAAARDWASFLEARSIELVSGGRLVVQMVGTSDDGEVTARRLMRAMAEVGAALAAEGAIDKDRLDRYMLPVYARTAVEAQAPLGDDSQLANALAVDEIRVDPVANPYLEKWRQDDDNATYAKSYAAFVRGFTESNLRLHLLGTTHAGADAVADEFFSRLEERFAADPMADRFEDWTLTVVVTRRAD